MLHENIFLLVLLRKRYGINTRPVEQESCSIYTFFCCTCSHSGCTTNCYYTQYYCYCSAGQFSSPYGYVVSTSSCSTCPGGKYQSNWGATSCNTCPAVSGSRVLENNCSALRTHFFSSFLFHTMWLQGLLLPNRLNCILGVRHWLLLPIIEFESDVVPCWLLLPSVRLCSFEYHHSSSSSKS
jgi:hypothetical protein